MSQVLFREIPNWFSNHQTIVGCIIIGTSTVCLALSGLLKSKGDRAAASRKADEKAKSRRIYAQYLFAIIICGAWTFYGTFLTKEAADKAAQKAGRIQTETRDQISAMERKFGEKIQAVLVKLNAAKQEDSERITEEKIRVLKNDFSEWAEEFVTNMPTEKQRFAQMKVGLQKKQDQEANQITLEQKQRSAQSYPVFSFATRFLEESVRAFAAKTSNTNIVISKMELPENLFEKPMDAHIRFNTNAIWTISTLRGWTPAVQHRRGYDINQPYFRLTFRDSHDQQSGEFHIQIDKAGNKMTFFYSTSLPTPNPESINGEIDFDAYESTTRAALQKIIKAQLLQLQE